jgi:hypothetical protein
MTKNFKFVMKMLRICLVINENSWSKLFFDDWINLRFQRVDLNKYMLTFSSSREQIVLHFQPIYFPCSSKSQSNYRRWTNTANIFVLSKKHLL